MPHKQVLHGNVKLACLTKGLVSVSTATDWNNTVDFKYYICLYKKVHVVYILYFFKHSCTNIFRRRSLCTFYSEDILGGFSYDYIY